MNGDGTQTAGKGSERMTRIWPIMSMRGFAAGAEDELAESILLWQKAGLGTLENELGRGGEERPKTAVPAVPAAVAAPPAASTADGVPASLYAMVKGEAPEAATLFVFGRRSARVWMSGEEAPRVI